MKKTLETDFYTKDYSLKNGYKLYFHNEQNPHPIKLHAHKYYEIVFLQEGNISLEIDGTTYPASQYDMFLIPPHTKHRSILHDLTQPYQRFVFWLSEQYLEQLINQDDSFRYITEKAIPTNGLQYHLSKLDFNTLESKMIRILEEQNLNRYGKALQLDLFMKDFFLSINRLLYEKIEPNEVEQDLPLYTNIILFIDEHLDEDLSLDRLANEFYVSKYHISHLFKENIGITVLQYITKKRLYHCQQALCTNINITNIYKSFGFNTYTCFYRAFKKEFGMSPQEYQTRTLTQNN